MAMKQGTAQSTPVVYYRLGHNATRAVCFLCVTDIKFKKGETFPTV